jgi:hypothetical protein
MSDAPMTQPDEVLEDEPDAFVIVIHHAGEAAITKAAIDENRRKSVALHGIEHGVADFGREDQQTAHLAVRQCRDELVTVTWPLGSVCHQAHESSAPQLDFEASHQRAEQRVAEIGHDDPDKIRLLRAKRGRNGIRQIAELPGNALDSRSRRLGHLSVDAAKRP